MAQARKKSDTGFEFTLLQHVKYGLRESGFLLLAGIALFFLAALLSFSIEDPAWTHTGTSARVANLGGIVGAWIADVSLYFFGYLAYLLPLAIVFCGWRLFHRGLLSALDGEIVFFRTLGALVAVSSGCGFLSLSLAPIVGVGSAGGLIGDLISAYLVEAFGLFGARLFQIALFLAAVNLATGISWLGVLDVVGAAAMVLVSAGATACLRLRGIFQRPAADKPREKAGSRKTARRRAETGEDLDSRANKTIRKPKQSEKKAKRRVEPVIHHQQSKAAGNGDEDWSERILPINGAKPLPDIELLDEVEQEKSGYSSDALSAMSVRVEELLRDFGVDVQVVAVEPGPVITRFELNPAPGVKVSRISNLAKDLARGLSVISVRVVEVIPGKSVIGLEIPNQHRQVVSLREVFDSSACRDAASPLTLALGKDISGKPIVANLAKMPHLLIAGTTGSGKSVGVNAMLLSMLFKARAEDVRLILVDPKMLELSVYEDIPHLLAPVVTDMKDAANALRWCVGEMERRYRLMAALKVRNIAGFNKIVAEAIATAKPIPDPLYTADPSLVEQGEQQAPTLEPLPFIVVVIDELADMMMIVGKKVEELIARLAQKARASGIHLILATQRPSVDVITGLIKANVPTRIAFQVSSKVDSRTILDQMGAEALLGHGDMLFLPPGTAFPQRVHGAFVADHEVNNVVAALKTSGKPDYSDAILQEPSDSFIPGIDPAASAADAGESDPLYDQAVQIVLESRKASISYVQRRLKIGYNRAARMMEDMEAAGVVGSVQNNGGREILVPGSNDT